MNHCQTQPRIVIGVFTMWSSEDETQSEPENLSSSGESESSNVENHQLPEKPWIKYEVECEEVSEVIDIELQYSDESTEDSSDSEELTTDSSDDEHTSLLYSEDTSEVSDSSTQYEDTSDEGYESDSDEDFTVSELDTQSDEETLETSDTETNSSSDESSVDNQHSSETDNKSENSVEESLEPKKKRLKIRPTLIPENSQSIDLDYDC